MANDTVFIINSNGGRSGPWKATFSGKKIVIFAQDADVSETDSVERQLPNGKIESYRILDCEHYPSFHGIPANIQMSVEKSSRPAKSAESSRTVVINNSHGIQVGDYNSQHFIEVLRSVVTSIDQSSAAPADKEEAKSLLRKFLAHPLTSAALGAGASALSSI